jgi:lysozyme family protein
MQILSEERISELISEQKPLPSGLDPLAALTRRNQHDRKDYTVVTPSGNEFLVAIRRSALNMLDFSVILGYQLPNLHTIFRLRRYNGKSHHHTNTIERQTFYDFHFHTATERYQRPGFREDHFAERTNRHYSLESAIQCLLDDCGFRPPMEKSPLFTGQVK